MLAIACVASGQLDGTWKLARRSGQGGEIKQYWSESLDEGIVHASHGFALVLVDDLLRTLPSGARTSINGLCGSWSIDSRNEELCKS